MVAFFAPSVTINEGNMGDVCVQLSTGAGGPNTLQNPLTVVLTVTNNGKAGVYIYNFMCAFNMHVRNMLYSNSRRVNSRPTSRNYEEANRHL